jgi:hypothetical protein
MITTTIRITAPLAPTPEYRPIGEVGTSEGEGITDDDDDDDSSGGIRIGNVTKPLVVKSITSNL